MDNLGDENAMKTTFKTLIGKSILVGIAYMDETGVEIDRIQFHGIIVRARKNEGIVIEKAKPNGEFTLPPDLRAISIANPGEYRLRSTGEVVVNPDLLTTWTVTKP